MVRGILQRVTNASVTVKGKKIAKIERGVVVLVGICREDTPADAEYLARKILNTRLWPNEQGKAWDKSVLHMDYDVLLVSQFTLHGIMKGNKPDFHRSMNPTDAKKYFDDLVALVKKGHKEEKVAEGEFGAMMEVELVNDGPVTLIFDSHDRKK